MPMEYQGYDKNFALTGRTALITGGAAGIGRAIAELYVEKGARVALVDRSEHVAATAAELGENAAIGIQADVTDSADVHAAVERVVAEFGRIDVLVNNAGVVALDWAEELSEADWDLTLNVNLKGVFLMCQTVGRHMLESGGGRIVNMASQAAEVALDKHLAYCTSKAGVVGLTKVLASEWGPRNVRVNAISPTVALTELGRKAWAGEVGERMKEKIPARRFVYPEEIAGCALYLASDAADMINGANLVIDGGYSIQ
ncbi:SDR family oxidoreductase [Salinisphaera hydrothermalis]|uniref:SDR family oxidoreductase n=1 Tax=Salinisphaera hydrothermalis TaxID=563188 RepID=UPI00333E4509